VLLAGIQTLETIALRVAGRGGAEAPPGTRHHNTHDQKINAASTFN
jgi:hypothetical protein